eukprot:1820557-Pyramimonas_sp.AAC.2
MMTESRPCPKVAIALRSRHDGSPPRWVKARAEQDVYLTIEGWQGSVVTSSVGACAQTEVATCEETRNIADEAMVVLTGFEQRMASSWSQNQHGGKVITGEYPEAALGDMDLLD